MHIYEVLKQPVDTEKTRYLTQLYEPQYVFRVDGRANKQQIKEAVEKIFNVNVLKVRVVHVKPKHGRYGRRVIVRDPSWKKAIVTLAGGQRLDIFEGV